MNRTWRTTSWWFVALGVVAAAAGIVLLATDVPWSAAILFFVALLLVAFCTASLHVDGAGIVVRVGLGLPTIHAPYADLQHVSHARVNPWRWGGWGYRGSLRWFGRAAVLLGPREVVTLRFTDGRTLLFSTNDAAAVVDAVRGLRPDLVTA